MSFMKRVTFGVVTFFAVSCSLPQKNASQDVIKAESEVASSEKITSISNRSKLRSQAQNKRHEIAVRSELEKMSSDQEDQSTQVSAQPKSKGGRSPASVVKIRRASRMKQSVRKAAAVVKKARSKAAAIKAMKFAGAVMNPGGTPDYFNVANFANSPLPSISGNTIVGGLRKFVDTLPGLTAANQNNLGQYIPIANPDTISFPGSDYYEIGLIEYSEKMHSDLPASGTRLRGYIQLNNGTDPKTKLNTLAPSLVHYLGPLILANGNRPVRVKFTNMLPTGAAGNLFIPVDTTVMGAGKGPNNDNYTQNRATLHLHGGKTPWISDGTPHQWTTPAGETTSYPQGVAVSNVPDMPDPGPGSMTFFYSNQQSARLMFYHDHSYGITRLNVYAGEAAGYLITDGTEEDMISNKKALPDLGGVYHYGVPLVIQDRTFVPKTPQLAAEDPTWDKLGYGNLWFPHVYMPNQNPNDPSGANMFGRWDYGPWFWPPVTAASGLVHTPVIDPATGWEIPATPNPSLAPEGFMDTPIVNGTAYPKLSVTRRAYRFRILNASNDRSLNLQLYYTDPVGATVMAGGSGYTTPPTVTFSGGGASVQAQGVAVTDNIVNAVAVTDGGSGYTSPPNVTLVGGGGSNASAVAVLTNGVVTAIGIVNPGTGYTSAPDVVFDGGTPTSTAVATASITGVVSGITITNPGSGYTSAPTVTISGGGGSGAWALASPDTEVRMVPAVKNPAYPPRWPTDERDGGVPDPTMAGPSIIQIGTESGFLPAPVVLPNVPINYNYNRRDIVVLNVSDKTLFLAPAERADVIVDFSQVPAWASHVILYNDSPAPVPAFDPRFDYYTGGPDQTDTGGAPTTLPGYGPNTRTIMRFDVSGPASAPFDLTNLQRSLPDAYLASQPAPVIPQTLYPGPYKAANDTYSRIQTTSLTFTPAGANSPTTVPVQPKAIQELFELDYGRMNATMGVELPLTNFATQTTVPLGYIDPVTESIKHNEPQIWKVTHNGVDTHAIHFHFFDVQLVNRVGWDGAIRPPDPNEVGWKETVRMNPLEDAIVALRPTTPDLPFTVPDSIRLLDPTKPPGPMSVTSPANGNAITVDNAMTNFGWEYVWHCHILGHEENDMMRPVVFKPGPVALPQIPVTAVAGNSQATVSFPMAGVTSQVQYYFVTSTPGGIVATGLSSPINVPALTNGTTYTFTVSAVTVNGNVGPFGPSNSVTPMAMRAPAPTNLSAIQQGSAVSLAWSDQGRNGSSFVIQRATDSAFTTNLTTYTTGPNITNYLDTIILPLQTYYYRVYAFNGANVSGFSNVTSLTTVDFPPLAPSNLTARVGYYAVPRRRQQSPMVALAWQDNSNNETRFEIQRSVAGANPVWTVLGQLGRDQTRFTDYFPFRNTTYQYRVKALNAVGSSDFTNIATVQTGP